MWEKNHLRLINDTKWNCVFEINSYNEWKQKKKMGVLVCVAGHFNAITIIKQSLWTKNLRARMRTERVWALTNNYRGFMQTLRVWSFTNDNDANDDDNRAKNDCIEW